MNFALRLRLFALLLLWPGVVSALTIQLDYTYDTGHFLSGTNASRGTLLQQAADSLASHLTDNLLAITPGGSNTWTLKIDNPTTGGTSTINNLSVPANTLIVYVGGRSFSQGELGIGGESSTISASGNTTWLNTVVARGQSGAQASTPTDYGPWGGVISFDTAADWYFGSSTVGLSGTEDDFYSVALHELGHVLGIGLADSWNSQVFNGMFDGAHSEASYGGAVPLDSGAGHWAEGTKSTLPGTSTIQETEMDPTLTEGTRKLFTTLDYDGLEDIGWQVVAIPEPGIGVLLGAGLGIGLWIRRRRG